MIAHSQEKRTPCRRLHLRVSRPAGFSLVELMVAMTLGLLLTAGVVTIFIGTSRTHAELGNASRQMENGRYALQALGTDIRLAGFYGEFYKTVAPASLPSPCATDIATLRTGIGLPIQGAAGAASAPLTCLPGYLPNTDVLVVRRAATVSTPFNPEAATPIDQMIVGTLYLQSVPATNVLSFAARTGNASVFTLTHRDLVGGAIVTARAPVRRYLQRIYYVRQCSDCTGSGDGIPTLTLIELRGTSLNTDAPTPIAEGVENLQLRYGIDDSENGTPDRYLSAPGSVSDWFNVVAVETNLLVRAIEPSAGYSDSKTYVLGDTTVAASGDEFKRHVFVSIFRAVNQSSRREQ